MAWRRFMQVGLPPLVIFVLAAAALQAYVRISHAPIYLLPAPTDVGRTLLTEHALFLSSVLTTTEEAIIGFVASAIFGVVAAIALSASSLVRRAFYPYTVFFQTVPIVAIAPLLVIWFRAGIEPVAICAFIVSVFPVIANTLNGLRSTDPALVDLFRLYGASCFATLLKLRLPSSLPNLITGMRIAGGLAVIGAVVAEFLVGTLGEQEGLGVRIVSAAKYGRSDQVFAGVLLACALGLLMFGALNLTGYLLLRKWDVSAKE